MARLPVPGSDDGKWGTILNEYLAQSLDDDGNLKPGVVGASQVADDALPQAKIQNLATDLASKVDNNDVRLTDQVGYYPPSAYGFFATTVPVRLTNVASDITSTALFLARVWIPAGNTITTAATYVYLAGTLGLGGNNGFAVYTDSGTLVATTPTDNSLWAATGWRSKNFATPIAAQSTGRFAYVGILCTGYSSPPSIIYNNDFGNQIPGGVGGINAQKRHTIFNNASSFPASFDPTTYGEANTYLPLIGLA